MTIGIADIAGYVPEGRVNLEERLEQFGVTRSFLEEKTGSLQVAVKNEGQETSDLAEAAVRALAERQAGLLERVEMLVLVTQNPDGYGLPHTSAILHGRLGLLDSVAAFDVSLGCSGWVYGLSIAKSFMESNGLHHGLLVTADPYSKVVDPEDRNTALLFGDAATATLLSDDGVEWDIGRFVFGTDGTRAADLRVQDNRKLFMNGRSIFTFSATRVPGCITDALRRNDLGADQVDRYLLHQGSRFIVDTIGKRLGAEERTPFLAGAVGNTVSSTIPLMLGDGACRNDNSVVACGFGVGLSWAATVLRRKT